MGHRRSAIINSKAGTGFPATLQESLQWESPSVREHGRVSLSTLLPVSRHQRRRKLHLNKQICEKQLKKVSQLPMPKERQKEKEIKGQIVRMSILFSVLLSSHLKAQEADREEICEHTLPSSGLLACLLGHITSHSTVPEIIKSAIVVLLVPKTKKSFLQNGLQEN